MTDIAGIGNSLMLFGLVMLIFNMMWAFIFGMMHTLMSMTGGPRTSITAIVLMVWGYFLTSLTMSVLVQSRQAIPVEGTLYVIVCAVVLLLYILADRMGAIWVAERKLDSKMAAIVNRLHWLAGTIFLYGLAGLIFWPESGHINLTKWFVGILQQLLVLKFFGLVFGVFGIFYIIRMLMRVIKFIRIGPKGLPPFPESMRK
ncbi:hypothetical protein K8S19_06195 [bacterium]|nr:hypothetical protein [bacterium]